MNNKPLHINAEKDSIADIVLMPGDPLRAKYIAENFLEDAEEVCNLRNMLGYTGLYKGHRVTVMGHGMGIPSIGIYVYELFKFYDVKRIIRIGTCGATKENISVPDLILGTSSYTESSFALEFGGVEEHIAYPSNNLNNTILNVADDLELNIHAGDILTMEIFGPYGDGEGVLNRVPSELNIVAEEMESFALFYLGNLFKKEVACILTVVDSKFSNVVLSTEEREKHLNDMIKLGLESIIK